ncbi:NlpC/P60 family protein [Neisseria sp. Ec49-e6-T10]|uniref:NlpC/P60 family protein n=1 Tax=Neisseria sp. Ec49-e6-T10 TaxID=3140744 RepID=UPI003EBD0B29
MSREERVLKAAIGTFDLGTGKDSINKDGLYKYGQFNNMQLPKRENAKIEVDSSGLIYYALKNSGHPIDQDFEPDQFSTSALFKGDKLSQYTVANFDKIDRNDLQVGDIIFLQKNKSTEQHVGIVANNDPLGKLYFYGSQTSTGPAVTELNSYWDGVKYTVEACVRPKESFYHPEHDLTLNTPAGFEQRYTQIKNLELTTTNQPGKPDYQLFNPTPFLSRQIHPEVQSVHSLLTDKLSNQFDELGVSSKHADAILAQTTHSCFEKGLNIRNIAHVGINIEQNTVYVVGKDSTRFVSVDAISASRVNPKDTLLATSQLVENEQMDAQNRQVEKNIQQEGHGRGF